jgi:hypothetical protein
MTDYLDRIVSRARGDGPRVLPRLPSLFEPGPEAAPVDWPVFSRHDSVDVRPRAAAVMSPGDPPPPGASLQPGESPRPPESSISAVWTPSFEQDRPRGLTDQHGARVVAVHAGATSPQAARQSAYQRAPGEEEPVPPEGLVQHERLTPRRPTTAIEPVVEAQKSVLVVRGGLSPSSSPAHGSDVARESTPQGESAESPARAAEVRHRFLAPAAAAPMRPTATSSSESIIAAPARISAGPPTIKITIGRIDVRAVTAPSVAPRSSSGHRPGLSLDDYLKQRSGGRP